MYQREIGVCGGSTYGPKAKSQRLSNPEISESGGHMPPIPTINVSEVIPRRVKSSGYLMSQKKESIAKNATYLVSRNFRKLFATFSTCDILYHFSIETNRDQPIIRQTSILYCRLHAQGISA